MFLVTGGTGTTGSEVVRRMVERGMAVRVLTRDPATARKRLGDDVELAVGDLADRAAVRAALDGAEGLVMSCADDPRRVEWETRLIDDGVAAGISRIVKLSTVGAGLGAPVAFWEWHGEVEEHLRASGADHVILQSAFYMSNLLAASESVAQQGRIFAPAGDARIAMIDPHDVGTAAAAAAGGSGESRRTLVITGPEAITYARCAEDLGNATGRPVEFVDVPEEVARESMVASGMPEPVADQVVGVYRALREGACEDVTDDFRALTGRPPRTFAEFAAGSAAAFAPRPVAAL